MALLPSYRKSLPAESRPGAGEERFLNTLLTLPEQSMPEAVLYSYVNQFVFA